MSRSPGDREVVVHSSWLGIGSAVFTPAFLVLFGALLLDARGPRLLPLVVLGLGITTAAAVVTTFPRRSRLRADGITVVRMGRRIHLPWTEITAISRGPGTLSARARSLREPPAEGGLRPAGTVSHLAPSRRPDRRQPTTGRPSSPSSGPGRTTAGGAERHPDGDEHPVSGGLVAHGRGRRRWLLADQVESREQYDAIADLLTQVPSVRLRARRPHAGAPPTDLYRRRR